MCWIDLRHKLNSGLSFLLRFDCVLVLVLVRVRPRVRVRVLVRVRVRVRVLVRSPPELPSSPSLPWPLSALALLTVSKAGAR